MDLETRINRWAVDAGALPEDKRTALCKIRQWVYGVCRKQEITPQDVLVSAFPQKGTDGETTYVTLICIIKNLPESPLITINKSPEEVSMEDILGCYKLVNYCDCSD